MLICLFYKLETLTNLYSQGNPQQRLLEQRTVAISQTFLKQRVVVADRRSSQGFQKRIKHFIVERINYWAFILVLNKPHRSWNFSCITLPLSQVSALLLHSFFAWKYWERCDASEIYLKTKCCDDWKTARLILLIYMVLYVALEWWWWQKFLIRTFNP